MDQGCVYVQQLTFDAFSRPSFYKVTRFTVRECGVVIGAASRGRPTHLLRSSTLDCLSRDTSGLRLLSLLVRLQM